MRFSQAYACKQGVMAPWVFRVLAINLLLLGILMCPFASASKVIELRAQGEIGPGLADYLVRGIEKGQSSGLILIQIDTPGGLLKSTRQIVQAMLNSKVPIVGYVSPAGARAASAGTYLLYAATIAAMAPGTHLGAASPVSLVPSDAAIDKKIRNDAAAYLRALAQLRGRSVAFAQKAVKASATLSATEALKAGAITLMADSRDELLAKLHGQSVTQDGRLFILNTQSARVESLQPDWRMQFLSVITSPTLAYMLLLIGIYGLIFEFLSPGMIAPGVIGAIALMLALYALQLLPMNYSGLGLIILGVIFIVAESFIPSFGALGLGGTVAFVIGSVLLIDPEHSSFQIAWSAIWAMAAANLVVLALLLRMALKTRRMPIINGTQVLIGTTGRTLGAIDLQGQAVFGGEIWNVCAKEPIRAKQLVKVMGYDGLNLQVEEIKGA